MTPRATKPAIVGIAGPVLMPEEAVLFRAHPPLGAILFARNIRDPAQLGQLTHDLRRTLPPNAVLMVDQEGGRVARLRPPHWRAHPPASVIGARFATNPRAGLRLAWLTGALIGAECVAAGFDLVAAPVLDLSVPGAHDVIGDRAFAQDGVSVARLGRAMGQGLMAAGAMAVGKHAPGHGRARVDSHLELPRVEANDLDADVLPFAANADLPWFMTAHIVFPAFDPILPVTLSRLAIAAIIRGRMGFKGVLATDDLAMRALTGSPAERACRALAAGCDVALYCAGDLAGTASVLAACPVLTLDARDRIDSARAMARARHLPLDIAALAAERDRLLA